MPFATPGIHSNETETFGTKAKKSRISQKKKKRMRKETCVNSFMVEVFAVDLTACTLNTLANTIDALSRKKFPHKYQIQSNSTLNDIRRNVGFFNIYSVNLLSFGQRSKTTLMNIQSKNQRKEGERNKIITDKSFVDTVVKLLCTYVL